MDHSQNYTIVAHINSETFNCDNLGFNFSNTDFIRFRINK